jgi:hypothetical protein
MPTIEAKKVGITRYRQVADAIRDYIESNGLKPDDLIPSYRELALTLPASEGTVHRALAILEGEGTIRRVHGRGTVVVDRNATGEFAIVVRPALLRPDASPYCSLASTAIAECLGARNSAWGAKLHVGRMTQDWRAHLDSLDLLHPDVLKRLRGVFSFQDIPGLDRKLAAAKVPVVYMGGRMPSAAPRPDEGGNRVCFDYVSLYEKAFAHLKEVGCHRVGALVGVEKEATACLSVVARVAESHGLQLPPVWLRGSAPGSDAESNGYDAFCQLWKEARHPDGLLVTDDMTCRGVLRAMLHLGVEPPGQVRLVSHANRGVAFPYHKAVTRVEFDPVAKARLAVEMMIRLLREPGAPARTVWLPAAFVKGETT